MERLPRKVLFVGTDINERSCFVSTVVADDCSRPRRATTEGSVVETGVDKKTSESWDIRNTDPSYVHLW